MTRQEKVFKAIKLFDEAKELLESAGFKLIFDSYNDTGVYAVPEQVDFPDDCAVETGECDKSFEELTDASVFLMDCPVVLEANGLYNDGTRLVNDVPKWWKGWNNFIKPKKAKENA